MGGVVDSKRYIGSIKAVYYDSAAVPPEDEVIRVADERVADFSAWGEGVEVYI